VTSAALCRFAIFWIATRTRAVATATFDDGGFFRKQRSQQLENQSETQRELKVAPEEKSTVSQFTQAPGRPSRTS
jgi:hypothetical protein